MLKEKIRLLAKKYAPETIEIRRHLHAYPELSYKEFQTSAFVQDKLKEMGIPFEIKATTGVVGILKGMNPDSRIVALRADMDALPIREENDVPYKSKNEGIMHACGHDAHTSILLGASKILNELKAEWEGTIKLIFQPGEEKNPGGASLLIKEDVLHNPQPEAIFGLHVHPGLEIGRFSFRGGPSMASADEIYITVRGKGGHAATPQLSVDTVLIASHIVVALQQVISRNKNPFTPSVLTIGSFQGGYTTNVIPSEVKLMGTFRAIDETWRFQAHQLIHRICKGIGQAMGAEIDVLVDVGYPVVNNDEKLYPVARRKAEEYAGPENVEETEVRMGSEDFGYYTQEIPGCFYRIGVMNKAKGITSGVHTPTFNIDESAIEKGMGMMAWLGASISFTHNQPQ
jgi:amidohydrolase